MTTDELAMHAYNIYARMGIPLHFQFLTDLIIKDTKEKVSEQRVLSVLSKRPYMFRQTRPGAFFILGKTDRHYPAISLEEVVILRETK